MNNPPKIKFQQVSIPLSGKLNMADDNFLAFLKSAEYPITKEQVTDFYKKYIMRDDKYLVKREDCTEVYLNKYYSSLIRSMAMQWFDRRLGKLVRIGFLTLQPKYLIN